MELCHTEQTQIPNTIEGQVSEPLGYGLILHWGPVGPGGNNCKSIRQRQNHGGGVSKENTGMRAGEETEIETFLVRYEQTNNNSATHKET